MLRADFDKNLRELQHGLFELSSLVQSAIASSLEALTKRDQSTAKRVIAEDDVIDQKRYELEELCVDLIATQQPLASDLRTLISVLHISVELERMGDYAEGIAKIALMMGDEPPLKPLIDIPRMAEKATAMLQDSMHAFLVQDSDAARRVCDDDDEVDALYDQVYRELLTYMLQDPQTISRATYLLWVAHDLERIADRATNIAERVIFLVTGEFVQINVSKY